MAPPLVLNSLASQRHPSYDTIFKDTYVTCKKELLLQMELYIGRTSPYSLMLYMYQIVQCRVQCRNIVIRNFKFKYISILCIYV